VSDITVNPVNDAPTANAGSATTDEDTAVTITLTGADVEGDTPSQGSVSFDRDLYTECRLVARSASRGEPGQRGERSGGRVDRDLYRSPSNEPTITVPATYTPNYHVRGEGHRGGCERPGAGETLP
jgi:hypothetical protein